MGFKDGERSPGPEETSSQPRLWDHRVPGDNYLLSFCQWQKWQLTKGRLTSD